MAAEFPGLFSYRELRRLDVRDLRLWMRQAKIKQLNRRIQAIQSARVAQAEDKHYSGFMNQLTGTLHMIENGYQETVKENWDSLKTMSGKRRKR